MLLSFFRTLILLFCLIGVLRLTGKRQLGELQPGELVVTILLSQIAAAPMQDTDIPLSHTLVCLLTLAGCEVLLSAAAMKSMGLRRLIDGKRVVLVRDGVPDLQALKRLRYTVDDLMEGLRQKNVFDLSQVQTALAETNGALSVQLKAAEQPAPAKLVSDTVPEPGFPQLLIADGKPVPEGMSAAGLGEKAVEALLQSQGVSSADEVFLLTVDRLGGVYLVKKESVK